MSFAEINAHLKKRFNSPPPVRPSPISTQEWPGASQAMAKSHSINAFEKAHKKCKTIKGFINASP